MNTDDTDLRPITAVCGKHKDVAEPVMDIFDEVDHEPGDGLPASVYREAMRLAWRQVGSMVRVAVPVPVRLRGAVAGLFQADLVRNDAVLVELRSWEQLLRPPESQTIGSLRATPPEVGFRRIFGPIPRCKRWVMDHSLKKAYLKLQNR
jgi:GxxExxY protein